MYVVQHSGRIPFSSTDLTDPNRTLVNFADSGSKEPLLTVLLVRMGIAPKVVEGSSDFLAELGRKMQQPFTSTVLVGPAPRIAVEYAGSGEPVIFLHGIGGNRFNWVRAMAALAPNFFVMAWDARGYGDSDDYLGPLTDFDFVADLVRVLDHFEVAKCHIVGLSMGVFNAIDFYDQHPDRVKSLVLSGGATENGETAKNDREIYLKSRLEPLLNGAEPSDRVEEMLKSLLADTSNKSVVVEASKSLLALRKDSYIKSMRCYAATTGRSDKFAKVTVPTLGIVGEYDRLTTPERMAELIALVPEAKLEIIKSAAHLPNIEQPEKFNQVLGEFLSCMV